MRTVPAKKPRTECCCQPVAFMMAATVVPSGWPRRSRIVCCFVVVFGAEAPSGRLRLAVSCFAPAFAEARAELRSLAFWGPTVGCFTPVVAWAVLRGICGSPFGCGGVLRRHHRSPAVASSPAGQGSDRAAQRPVSASPHSRSRRRRSPAISTVHSGASVAAEAMLSVPFRRGRRSRKGGDEPAAAEARDRTGHGRAKCRSCDVSGRATRILEEIANDGIRGWDHQPLDVFRTEVTVPPLAVGQWCDLSMTRLL